jgi:hypothetical protein
MFACARTSVICFIPAFARGTRVVYPKVDAQFRMCRWKQVLTKPLNICPVVVAVRNEAVRTRKPVQKAFSLNSATVVDACHHRCHVTLRLKHQLPTRLPFSTMECSMNDLGRRHQDRLAPANG